MGILEKMESRRKALDLELTKEEAGIALSALVAFEDDDLSDVEAGIMRKYYALDDATSLGKKMEHAGVAYPKGLSSIENTVLERLTKTPLGFRLRTIAIGYLLARADGSVSEVEFERLDRYSRALSVSYQQAREYGATKLRELDPQNKDNWIDVDETSEVQLSLAEAAVALSALVAFRDDDLSDAEAVVMRKYFSLDEATGLQQKLESAGKAYPDALPAIQESVMRALSFGSREFRVRTLAIALELAEADGTIDEAEIKLVQEFGKRFGIAMYEIMHYKRKRLREVMT
jgi:tellurite resistance protein